LNVTLRLRSGCDLRSLSGVETKEKNHETKSMKGYMYILECAYGKYYTGSTIDLERRIEEHQNGEGANFTAKNLPIRLVYFEEYERVDQAFYREKQVQGWSRKKKEALINGKTAELHKLAECINETHFGNAPVVRNLPIETEKGSIEPDNNVAS